MLDGFRAFAAGATCGGCAPDVTSLKVLLYRLNMLCDGDCMLIMDLFECRYLNQVKH